MSPYPLQLNWSLLIIQEYSIDDPSRYNSSGVDTTFITKQNCVHMATQWKQVGLCHTELKQIIPPPPQIQLCSQLGISASTSMISRLQLVHLAFSMTNYPDYPAIEMARYPGCPRPLPNLPLSIGSPQWLRGRCGKEQSRAGASTQKSFIALSDTGWKPK